MSFLLAIAPTTGDPIADTVISTFALVIATAATVLITRTFKKVDDVNKTVGLPPSSENDSTIVQAQRATSLQLGTLVDMMEDARTIRIEQSKSVGVILHHYEELLRIHQEELDERKKLLDQHEEDIDRIDTSAKERGERLGKVEKSVERAHARLDEIGECVRHHSEIENIVTNTEKAP